MTWAGEGARHVVAHEALHCGQASPSTQMGSVLPGYSQHVVPTPQAAHGQVAHAADVKKSVQMPSAQTWSVVHAVPQLPVTAVQWIGFPPRSVSV